MTTCFVDMFRFDLAVDSAVVEGVFLRKNLFKKNTQKSLDASIHTKEQVENLEDVNQEALLIAAASNGDVSAFRELYVRYQQRVFYVVLGIVKNSSDAEDIVQEAFIKAYRNLGSFKGQSSFYTWLYRIAVNLGIDATRRKARHLEISRDSAEGANVDSCVELDSSERPDELLERGEIKSHFDAAMKELSPEHRAVVMLREIDGLSYSEISEIVGCSKGTVMSRLHHARKKLQHALIQFFPNGKTENSIDNSSLRGLE